MDDGFVIEREVGEHRRSIDFGQKPRPRTRRGTAVLLAGGVIVLAAIGGGFAFRREKAPAPPPPPPPQVTFSTPQQASVTDTTAFLGQFSAVDAVELRAQVGGTLTTISFRDGQIVHQGDPLFVIDPRPYKIRLDQAVAQFQTAQAKADLAQVELWRAQQLKQTEFGTAETVDQRAADLRSAKAAIDTAKAAIMDAQLDLEFSRVAAPFSGRIGNHRVSVGNLVSGSRGGTSPTTLLATIVSLDPIYLDFDMSEADYLAYQKARQGKGVGGDIAISLDGDGHFGRHGTLDFIDNAVNRSSGTIHARATVPNPDLSITPGQFARLRVATSTAAPVLMVPPDAIVPDQARQMVMTVAADGTVVPKPVEIGDVHDGLRVIRSGLAPTDHVIIGGLVRVRPGAKVTPVAGTITPHPGDDG
ncbi:MAG TPA: efflux RND transporter periplasmic adaptor subunit [Acetobacteraceae bacterium]|nr:efflux RND transporter periplasmic adaptor subunit [Acetobacteraceae bacterium]